MSLGNLGNMLGAYTQKSASETNQELMVDDLELFSSDLSDQIEENLAIINTKQIVDHYKQKEAMTDQDWDELNHAVSAHITLEDVVRIDEATLEGLSRVVDAEYDIAMEGMWDNFKEKIKHTYTKMKKGNESLKAMIERIEEMDGYEAESGKVMVKAGKLKGIFDQSGNPIDFAKLNKVFDKYIKTLGNSPKDLMKTAEKDPEFDVVEWMESYYGVEVAKEDDKSKYLSLTSDMLLAVKAVSEATVIYTKPSPVKKVKTDKEYEYPVMSLKDMSSTCKELLKRRRAMVSAMADRQESAARAGELLRSIGGSDSETSKMVMKALIGVYTANGFNLIVEQSFAAQQNVIKAMFAAYKKK